MTPGMAPPASSVELMKGVGGNSIPRRRKRPKPGSSSSTPSKITGQSDNKPSAPTPRAPGGDTTPQAPLHPTYGTEANKNAPVSGLPSLGQEEKTIVMEEKPMLREALAEFLDRAREVGEKIGALRSRASREAEEDPGPRDEGASFLAAKQLLLMSYCRDLCSYAGSKACGKPLDYEGCPRRLVEVGTIMEKLRPMERKLKYQTDKLLRIATTPVHTGAEEASAEAGDIDDDPLSYRPRPEAMIPRGQNEGRNQGSAREESKVKRSSKSMSTGEDDQASGLYRAPRISSVPYDEDEAGGAQGLSARKEQRRLERSRAKLRRGEVMETLREAYGDQPETVRGIGNAGASGVSEGKMQKMLEADKERIDFEEDHMVRMTVSRKAKKARARMEKEAGRLETIADVGSAADFIRVARHADGFGNQMGDDEDDDLLRGAGTYGKKRKKPSKAVGDALQVAMGPVGRSVSKGRGRKR